MTADPIREAVARALIEAGFLDAYLNIGGVKDEAEAWAMLQHDLGALAEQGYVLVPKEAVRIAKHIGELRQEVNMRRRHALVEEHLPTYCETCRWAARLAEQGEP